MKKVILYNPRSANSGHRIPNSILQIGASIHGIFEYVFIDGNLESDPFGKIKSYMNTGKFKYFATTVMPGPQTVDIIPITKQIRKFFPDIYIIWGGYFPSMYYKVVMESGLVDFIIHGIGDYAFPNLLKVIENSIGSYLSKSSDSIYSELIEIKNLIFLHKNQIIKNKEEHKIDFSKLNPLPYEFLNSFYSLDKYIVKTFLGNRTTSYHASIGCPFECGFCAIVPMFDSRLSVQEPNLVYKNIKYLKDNFGVDAIEFNDNEFFFSEQRVAEISQTMKELNISWWAYGRIDILYRYKEDTLRLMEESGCKMIFFGAETGDVEMLRSVNKGGNASVDTVIKLLEKLKKFNIIPEYSFVVGFPARTPQLVSNQINKDIKFIKAIKRKHPETEIILNFYRPIESDSSETYKMAVEYGYKPPEILDNWLDPGREIHTFTSVKYFPWFLEKNAKKLKNFVTVLHAYYPSVSDFQLTRFQKVSMRILSFCRYHLGIYSRPYELKFLQNYWIKYKRPEEEGFYSE
jgi:anaerobic magnesium-protoporphyrin IX monomethyl ester cyclase